jgi:hypothetical protein
MRVHARASTLPPSCSGPYQCALAAISSSATTAHCIIATSLTAPTEFSHLYRPENFDYVARLVARETPLEEERKSSVHSLQQTDYQRFVMCPHEHAFPTPDLGKCSTQKGSVSAAASFVVGCYKSTLPSSCERVQSSASTSILNQHSAAMQSPHTTGGFGKPI